MDGREATKGVFLYTQKIESELMVRCLQAMLNIFPNIKFTSVVADEKFCGYRVHFSSPDEAEVLAKLSLTVYGRDITISPLTTCLTIPNISSRGDDVSESEIRDAVNNTYGRVLDIVEIPGSPSRRNGNTTNLRVYVDIPEIKELRIFNQEAYSEMRMRIPNTKVFKKVTFCCRRCKKDGHIARDCHQIGVTKVKVLVKDEENMPTDSTIKNDFNFEPSETSAGKNGGEEIIKTTGVNEEVEESAPSKSNPEEIELSEKMANIKIEENDNRNEINSKEFRKENSLDSNSDDDKQSVEICTNPSDTQQQKDGAGKAADDSNSHSPETPVRPALPSATPETPGPTTANQGPPVTPAVVKDTSVLSEWLQGYINNACEQFGILREDLDAFFINVKRKLHPAEWAKKLKLNKAKLKQLLQNILHQVYHSQQIRTNEDNIFVSWLEKLVERYDGQKISPQIKKNKAN